MTNPNDTLNELWVLSEEGKAKWWPPFVDKVRDENHIRVRGYRWWYSPDACACCDLEDRCALDLVTAHAERWLESTLEYYSKSRHIGMDCYSTNTTRWHTLPEAIRYTKENDRVQ